MQESFLLMRWSKLCNRMYNLDRIWNFDSILYIVKYFSIINVVFILIVQRLKPCKKYVTPKIRFFFDPYSLPCHTLSSFGSTPFPPCHLPLFYNIYFKKILWGCDVTFWLTPPPPCHLGEWHTFCMAPLMYHIWIRVKNLE